MLVQSLSVCVPGGCPNRCKFCVSRMHESPYPNHISSGDRLLHTSYEQEYCKRLAFARDNGCNTVILTGEGEPLMNTSFLSRFPYWNNSLSSPFRWIEIQTSGVELKNFYFLRGVGVSTVSLSLSDIMDSNSNMEMNGTPEKLRVDIDKLCTEIKAADFNLRLSLNMTDAYNRIPGTNQDKFHTILERAKQLGADQLTFRKLYVSGDENLEQNRWIKEHQASSDLMDEINKGIKTEGRMLEVLPFGAVRYSMKGLSLVVDDDCMSEEVKPVMKYLILRANCRLYTKWDDPGSLLF